MKQILNYVGNTWLPTHASRKNPKVSIHFSLNFFIYYFSVLFNFSGKIICLDERTQKKKKNKLWTNGKAAGYFFHLLWSFIFCLFHSFLRFRLLLSIRVINQKNISNLTKTIFGKKQNKTKRQKKKKKKEEIGRRGSENWKWLKQQNHG